MRLSLILSRLQLTYALVLHSGQTWYWYTKHLAEVGWQRGRLGHKGDGAAI